MQTRILGRAGAPQSLALWRSPPHQPRRFFLTAGEDGSLTDRSSGSEHLPHRHVTRLCLRQAEGKPAKQEAHMPRFVDTTTWIVMALLAVAFPASAHDPSHAHASWFNSQTI